jgi:NAD+ synthase (glutamine-hydrolysing)
MSERVCVVLAQLNLLVGDIGGNTNQVLEAGRRAVAEHGAHAVVFPELTLTGYPPEDLLLRPGLYRRIGRAMETLCQARLATDLIVGYPLVEDGQRYNAASVIRGGEIVATYRKQCLPNYAVFDEKRYFDAGSTPLVYDFRGIPVALTICEDVWEPGPVRDAVESGARLIINMNASPFHLEKWRAREQIVSQRARDNCVPMLYGNQVGGQDELVFDGHAFVADAHGEITQRSLLMEPSLVPVTLEADGSPVPGDVMATPADDESVYHALVLGVRDYVNKNGFPGVVIGLSGGIDSALTLTIAVDALGADRVEAVMMPSQYTSELSIEEARHQAGLLGVQHTVIPIASLFAEFESALAERFSGLAPDTTEENLQARTRGMLLMAISNKTGKMVLTTGNKSEMAVGYATLYGDMVGGFAAIKDVPKTMVYRLAAYRNRMHPVIPQRVIERPPSAELAPGQLDTDSLPPYDLLDAILERYVERDVPVEDIIAEGYDAATVRRVVRMVDRNEYKRRQAPPGVRVTPRGFGRDRRYPITSGYGREETG